GWDDDEQNWREAADAAVEAGVSAIGFHPRTCRQGYGGKADWETLREISEIVPVPVIGSGDLDSPSAVLRMLKETGCHGVMIARGAVGNPEIFRDSRNLLTESEPKQLISPEDRRRNASKHLRAAAEAFGEETAVRSIKKHLAGYIKGWPSASSLRKQLMSAENLADLLRLLD
ncbi:MAG: tRNA-dihydrouridine synthase, partial [Spirochaetaceae bacterium]|nr:tRNA-dihydrouridine synthase [Spirochaetaceae bacterium]